MLRPPPHLPSDGDEPTDSGAFGGLADVLEPDDDDAITSLRHLGAVNPSLRARAAAGPLSERARAPVQVQDFAFADTVFAPDIPEDPPPPSGPIYVNDDAGRSQQCLTPLAFPLPPPQEPVDLSTKVRLTGFQILDAVRRARDEMRELWAGTAEMVDGGGAREMWLLRRAFALWSCFQWSRADLTRAAMIGGAVFLTAATLGAVTMDLGEGDSSEASRAAREASAGGQSGAVVGGRVRLAHTLDQHTGRKIALHTKR